MPPAIKMTVELPADVDEQLVVLASRAGQSKAEMVAAAVADFVDRETAVVEGIRRGLADAQTGRLVPHDKAMRRIRRSVDKASPR